MSDEERGLLSPYFDARAVEEQVARGNHRAVVGGKWEYLGKLQCDFLIANGMRPEHFLLDIGCGALRGGIHAVAYLEPAHYFGTDMNQPLLDAGYDQELVPLGLAPKLPRAYLACNADFDFPWDVTFDYAMAQSLFTHLPFNFIRFCLARLVPRTRPGSLFFATYHAVADNADVNAPRLLQGGRVSHPVSDPYHYKFRDLEYACVELPWRVAAVPDAKWPHPRQKLVRFERL